MIRIRPTSASFNKLPCHISRSFSAAATALTHGPLEKHNTRILNHPENLKNVITIKQYNLLADCFTWYDHLEETPREFIAFDLRYPKIMQHIQDSQADILSLQEVDHLDDVYAQFLIDEGYDFCKAQRRDDDYCLIAFKRDVFDLLESYAL